MGALQQIDLATRAPGTESGFAQGPEGLALREGAPVGPAGTWVRDQIRNQISGIPRPGLPEEGEDPLRALIDQIRALRKEIDQILGKGDGGRDRFRRAMANAMAFSDARLYRVTHPELTGFKKPRPG